MKKCKCSLKNKITCKNCSIIKMCILLKNGNSQLKNNTPSGRKVSPVWYNHLSKNLKDKEAICKGMYSRFLKSELINATNLLIFYNNHTKQEIQRIKI